MADQITSSRICGVLLPVFSLPGAYGVGSLGKPALDFLHFLKSAGQTAWQVLPLGPTGFGDSPYQPFSAFAGNPYLIDLESLAGWGLLTDAELDSACRPEGNPVDYGDLFYQRLALLHKAAERFDFGGNGDYHRFCQGAEFWLTDFARFMALKHYFHQSDWLSWPEDIRLRDPEALLYYDGLLAGEIRFWKFTQFAFFTQWQQVRQLASELSIQLVGDLPIYPALDSADVWANRLEYQLDRQGRPSFVAGVPPDYFSATGQRWGNPLYHWGKMQENDFSWWRARIEANAGLYDVIRIDHFIGIVRYWAIPAECPTAVDGEWHPGPGKLLVEAMQQAAGESRLVAEDLGVLHPSVTALLQESNLAGMRVLQFAFDGNPQNPYLPHCYPNHTTCFVGTHDNDTLCGFLNSQSDEQLAFAKAYLNQPDRSKLPDAFIRAALSSVAEMTVIPMADWLGLGTEARINTPSTLGGNWVFRLKTSDFTPQLAAHMQSLTQMYGR